MQYQNVYMRYISGVAGLEVQGVRIRGRGGEGGRMGRYSSDA